MCHDVTNGGLDVAVLYGTFADALQLAVARRVAAPPAVIEDACQIAWSQLLRHRHDVELHAARGWLTTAAVREALRLLRRQRLEQPLVDGHDEWHHDGDHAGHDGCVMVLPATEPAPDQVAELHQRIAEIRRLPARQQRIVWLRGLGFAYEEIADQTGDTSRTVERQLVRARRTLRAGAAA
jgi:RNA polymerase sigma factor (sigma-70 family)